MKLFVFGCSFTAGNGCLDNEIYTRLYKKNEDELIWPKIISNKIGANLYNFGMGMNSNDKILDSIFENFNLISESDIVIIQMSFHHRFDIPDKKGGLISIAPNPSNIIHNIYSESEVLHFNYISTIMEDKIYKKRNEIRFNFLKELIIKYIKTKRCFLWSIEDEIFKYENIISATNNHINDCHWSYNGHREFSKYILDKINKLV